MRIHLLLLSFVAALGSIAYGSSHEVSVSGAVSFQQTASPAKVSTIKFNNASLIAAYLRNAGINAPEPKASDYELALDDTNYEIQVITKVSHTAAAVIASTGTNAITLGQITEAGKKSDLETHIQSDYRVDAFNGEVAVCGLTVHATVSGTNVLSNTGNFTGGTVSSEGVQGIISASYRTSGKAFDVVPPAP